MSCKPQYKGIRYDSLEELYRANGVSEQQKQQAEQLYSQYLDSLNKPNINPILQGNQQEQVKKFVELQERLNNKEFLEGAKNAFKSSKKLQQFGTQEQYNDYIARVSLGIVKNPSNGEYNYESKVKDIVYHSRFNVGNIKNKDRWRNGFYSGTKDQADLMADMAESSNDLMTTSALLINMQNPKITTYADRKVEDYKNTNDGFIIEATEKDALQLIADRDGYNIENFKKEYVVFEPEQIHILGSKQDIENFANFVSYEKTIRDLAARMSDLGFAEEELSFQKVSSSSIKEGVSELFEFNPEIDSVLEEFANDLSDRFNIPFKLVSESEAKQTNPNYNGEPAFYNPANKTAYLVKGRANKTSAIHEIFTHPFLLQIEKTNPKLYANLLKEAKGNKDVVNYVDSKYTTNKDHEYITRAIDLYAQEELDQQKDKGLIARIKELFAELSDYLKKLFNIPEVFSNSISPNITLRQLTQFAMYGKGKMNLNVSQEEVNKTLKAVNILTNLNNKQQQEFNKLNKGTITIEQLVNNIQIPKEQKQFVVDSYNEGNKTSEELAIDIASKYTYSVEINTTKANFKRKVIDEVTGEEYIDDSEATGEDASYYSNLTVLGGTNYTENEISTPLITPSIKGHAQFATDNGIGWFRSDEQDAGVYQTMNSFPLTIKGTLYRFSKHGNKYMKQSGKTTLFTRVKIVEISEKEFKEASKIYTESQGKKYVDSSKTRRILEVQSDLFQKGRGKKSLTETLDDTTGYGGGPAQAQRYKESIGSTQNQFLQLLNKDNNWVTFFIKSIIQDSAKKGYEKVLFPKGETAGLIEGFKDAMIRYKELEDKKNNGEELTSSEIEAMQQFEKAQKSVIEFYEIKVGNILEKQFGRDNVKTITDEYGNQWREVTINQARDLANILLQRNEANQIIGQANIKALSVLVDAINQKQDTLPHKYAHHYIAWFRDTPIVQEAIKKWGSEEALVQSIGEQVVKQKGEAYNWWNKFTKWIMNQFNSLSNLQKEELTQILTDAFLTRQDLGSKQDIEGFREFVGNNTTEQKSALDIEHARWAYNQLNNITPNQLQEKITNLADHKVSIRLQRPLRRIMERIGSINGINIHFHQKSFKKGLNTPLGYYLNGDVHYNTSQITLDTYVHEFTHLWLKVLEVQQPEVYKSILNKVEIFLESNSVLAGLINNRLKNYSQENRLQEASAILSGLTSIPSLVNYIGNELRLEGLNLSEVSDILGEELNVLYQEVKDQFDTTSLEDMDIANSSIFDIMLALNNDILSGKNVFEMNGTYLSDMKALGQLEGYYESLQGADNTVLTVADLGAQLTNTRKKIKSFIDMTQQEKDNFIDTHSTRYISVDKNGNAKWNMVGVKIPITIIDGKLDVASKSAVRELMTTLPNDIVKSWKEVLRKLQAGGLNYDMKSELNKLLQTKYGNPKYDINTLGMLAEIMGFNTGMVDILTLEDFSKQYSHYFGSMDLQMFKGLNPMIVVHSDGMTATDGLQISILSLEKMYNHLTGAENSQLFAHLDGMSLLDAQKKGYTYKQSSSTITNIQLGILAAYMFDKNPNLRIRQLGTLETSRAFKANTANPLELLHNIAHIKDIPQVYDAILNEDIKNIIDNAKDVKYEKMRQSFEEELRALYYHSIYYTNPENEVRANMSKKYFDLRVDEKAQFIKVRMAQILATDKNADQHNQEFIYLSRVLYTLEVEGYINISATSAANGNGYSTGLQRWLAIPYNENNPLVQWAKQKVQVQEEKAVNQFREVKKGFMEVAKPVWEKRAKLKRKVSLTDIGSAAFRHMFLQIDVNGSPKTLPFIWHNESKYFGHKMFNYMTKDQIMKKYGITNEDLALGDYIMKTFEKVLVEAEIIEIENSGLYKEEKKSFENNKYDYALNMIIQRGWDRSSGQVIVISKSSTEMAAAAQFKKAWGKMWDEALDVNAAFTNRTIAETADTYRSAVLKQINHEELLAQAGLYQEGSGDDITYHLTDVDVENSLNYKMSTNLEDIFNFFALSNIRQKLHSKESYLTYKAAMSYIKSIHTFSTENMQKKELEGAMKSLSDFYTAIVMNQRLPEKVGIYIPRSLTYDEFGNVKEDFGKRTFIDIGASLEMAGSAASFVFLGFSPKIALKSAFFNSMKMLSFGTSMLFARDTGLPDIRHYMEAHQIYFANNTRVRKWAEFYQQANASMYEITSSYSQNLTKKYVFNQQVAHAGNQYTDEIYRHINMVAFMLRDGSWDAHQYRVDAKGNESLVYDETKDKRLYKDGILTEDGKLHKEAIKQELIEDELMTPDDKELKYGYSLTDANTMKSIADKWIIGAYSAQAGANANHVVTGKQLGKFRRFFFDVIANIGIMSDGDVMSRIISVRKIKIDEDGNRVSKREAMQMANTIQSMMKAVQVLRSYIGNGERKKLTDMEKAALSRSFMWVMISSALWMVYGKFKDDEERREYFIDMHSIFLDTAFNSQLDEMMKSPLPTLSSWYRLINKGVKDPVSVMFYMPVFGRIANDINNFIDFTYNQN